MTCGRWVGFESYSLVPLPFQVVPCNKEQLDTSTAEGTNWILHVRPQFTAHSQAPVQFHQTAAQGQQDGSGGTFCVCFSSAGDGNEAAPAMTTQAEEVHCLPSPDPAEGH